jgi:hypothetical protein
MYSPSRIVPCPAFPMSVVFPDVDPEILEREAETDAHRTSPSGAGHRDGYLHRVLPALEQNEAGDMAHGLLAAGTGAIAARSHAETMRRRAIAYGSVRRARFWANVAAEIDRIRDG